MVTDIPTEFEAIEPPYDTGVTDAFAAEEAFEKSGEHIERRTEVRLLEDGGVHITQELKNQSCWDSMTLNGALAQKLRLELEETDDT